MIDRPSDIVILFGIVALIVTVFGYGYNDMVAHGEAPTDDTAAVYSDFVTYTNSSDYFKGASDDMSTGLETDSAGGTSDSFIVQMGLGLLKIGKVWQSVTHAFESFARELRIPPELLAIASGVLIITLALSIYLWWRGSSGK